MWGKVCGGTWFGGWNMAGGIGIMILLIVVALVVAVIVLRRYPSTRVESGDDALDLLKQRYASGEIGKDQFDTMKRDLRD